MYTTVDSGSINDDNICVGWLVDSNFPNGQTSRNL